MSTENVKKFYEAIASDEKLKMKLSELSQKYQGEVLDEETKVLLVNKEILPLASQMGFSFSLADLKQYETEMQQPQADSELSDEEMQAVAGGFNNTYCAIIGYDADKKEVEACFLCIWFGLRLN